MSYRLIAEAYRQIVTQSNATEEQLLEELTDSEKRKADILTEYGRNNRLDAFHAQHPKAKALFDSNLAAGELKHRARVPIKLQETSAVPHPGVADFIVKQGYHFTPDEYKAGIANESKTVGNPEQGIPYSTKVVQHKIGRLLERHGAPDEIKQKFMNDPFRTGAKTKDYDLYVTAHPHDIVGGSTGRGWTSCADIRPRPKDHPLGSYDGKGPAAKALPEELRNFTHMVYLVPRGGNLDTDAVARTSYKLHTGLKSGHQTLLPESSVYSTAPQGFKQSADKLMSELFDRNSDDVYKKHEEVYDDTHTPFAFSENPSAEHLDLVAKSQKRGDTSYMQHLYKRMNPTHNYKTKLLKSANAHLNGMINAANGNDPDKFLHVLHAAHELETATGAASFDMLDNPHVMDVANKAKDFVDISNPQHANAIIKSRYSSIPAKIARLAVGDKEARNYQEFKNLFHIADSGFQIGSGYRYNIPIAKKHDLGKNPLQTILSSALKEHNVEDPRHLEAVKNIAQSAYSSTEKFRTKSGGNFYDQLIDAENSNIDGVSNLLNHVARERVKNSGRGYGLSDDAMSIHDELAQTLYRTKPANRERLADAFNVGMTAKEIMKKGKAGIDSVKELNKKIKQAEKQKQQSGLNESFDLDGSFDYE